MVSIACSERLWTVCLPSTRSSTSWMAGCHAGRLKYFQASLYAFSGVQSTSDRVSRVRGVGRKCFARSVRGFGRKVFVVGRLQRTSFGQLNAGSRRRQRADKIMDAPKRRQLPDPHLVVCTPTSPDDDSTLRMQPWTWLSTSSQQFQVNPLIINYNAIGIWQPIARVEKTMHSCYPS